MHAAWWAMDRIASHIILSRISSTVRLTLPQADLDAPVRIPARDSYTRLKHFYGVGDFGTAMLIASRLRSLFCGPAVSVQAYVTAWHTGTLQMLTAGKPMDHRDALDTFSAGLPTNDRRYHTLRESLEHHVNRTQERDLPPLESVFTTALDIESTIQRSRPAPSARVRPGNTATTSAPRPSANTSRNAVSTAPNTTTTISTVASAVAGTSNDNCGNCGGLHPTFDCYQKGGVMHGRRDEVIAKRAFRTKAQAHVAVPDDDPGDTTVGPSDNLQIEEAVTVPDDNCLESAFVSVASTHVNNDIFFSSYVLASITSKDLASIASNDDLFFPTVHPMVFMSYAHLYNSIIDSGCTNHIIRDRRFFWTYSTSGVVPIQTANCGNLVAQARGDVKFCVTIGDKSIIWTLKNCFHVPDVPVNLLSLGAMREGGVDFHFPAGPVMHDAVLTLPDFVPELRGLKIYAKSVNCLSFLHCDFLEPPPPVSVVQSTHPIQPTPTPPTAFPVFPKAILSPDLWH